MKVVSLEGAARDRLLAASPEALSEAGAELGAHLPGWLGLLEAMGEEGRGLVAFDDDVFDDDAPGDSPAGTNSPDGGRIRGWLLYTVARRPAGLVLNSLPFLAYGGPVCAEADDDARTALLDAYREEGRRIGADVVSMGTSPFASDATVEAMRAGLGVDYAFENVVQTQSLDVHPLEAMNRKRRSAFKSEIARGERHGLVVTDSLAPAAFREWLAVYRGRYAEIGATPMPDAFHEAAYERGVPAGLVEFWGVFDGERLVGGSMFLLGPQVADYFSSAYRTESRDLYPNTLLLDRFFRRETDRPAGERRRAFNWQSSPNRGGVFQYKARWGATTARHWYLSTALNPDGLLFQTSPSEIRRQFPFRFVVPFSALPPDPPAPEADAAATPADGPEADVASTRMDTEDER